MQAIALLQAQRPHLHALIVGSDVVAYGGERSDGRSWGEWAKEDIALDPHRTHWLGALQTEEYHDVLAFSDVHLYLTVPFRTELEPFGSDGGRLCSGLQCYTTSRGGA